MDYFFYGTLMDADRLARIIGRRVPPQRVEAAVIEGYRRVRAAGRRYPVLVSKPGDRVEGRLVRGIGRREAARIAAFEGDEYWTRVLPVRAAQSGRLGARVFMARAWVAATPEEWVPGARRRHGTPLPRLAKDRAER